MKGTRMKDVTVRELWALSTYRAKSKEETCGSGLEFGNYMTVGREGTLRVGDRLSAT
jgi:hypothetical protein